ncbi:uncharacterized protein UV8b_00734 [Ustilaginoidea virens]|uniref:Hydrophobin n=1 Tax=Ustilaginoidea virens TaxID=1159556 RepID=A0A8E5HJL4_USTVR|nr:uncharacterized protein UV8b_00734 [Ustilaginoidea virens]QUC16493.1 hypothetical protein UV8b_00734 [Ustilaginoidea virens]
MKFISLVAAAGVAYANEVAYCDGNKSLSNPDCDFSGRQTRCCLSYKAGPFVQQELGAVSQNLNSPETHYTYPCKSGSRQGVIYCLAL